MITVDEIMTAKPCTLSEQDSLGDAHRLMAKENIHHIPIVDGEGQLLGLVSQHDVIVATHSLLDNNQGVILTPEIAQVSLDEVMVTDVQTTTPGASLRQAALTLHGYRYGCLPVVDEGQLVGIVTGADFIGVTINLLQKQEKISDEIEIADDLDIDELDDLDDLGLEVQEGDDWGQEDR